MKEREEPVLKHFKDLKAFIEYPNDMSDVYKVLKSVIQDGKNGKY